ncbi:hypothetical protein ACFXKY_15395 [Streptomyces canus]|uniref:hypothetical protein n=1 Tax=Streptomyces canus TaxID=58343 RepID=UPI0036761118
MGDIVYAATLLRETEHGMTVLGVTQAEWIAAVIAAIIVPPVLGWLTMFRHKATQQLPYLLLRVAGFRVPRDQREYLYSESWVPDLLAHLTDRKKSKLFRYWKGMAFALSLALYGARATANAMNPHPWRWVFILHGRLYDFAFVASLLLEGAVGIVSARFNLAWPWGVCLSIAQVASVVLFTRWRRKVGRDRYGLDA